MEGVSEGRGLGNFQDQRHEELSHERLDVLRRHVGGGWWMRGMRLERTAGMRAEGGGETEGNRGGGGGGQPILRAEAVAGGVHQTGAAAASQGRHRIPAILAGNGVASSFSADAADQDRHTGSSPLFPPSAPPSGSQEDGVHTLPTPTRGGGGRRERGAAWLRYKWFLQTAVELTCLSSTIGLLLLLVALHTHTINHSSCIPAQQIRNASPAPEVNFAQVFYFAQVF